MRPIVVALHPRTDAHGAREHTKVLSQIGYTLVVLKVVVLIPVCYKPKSVFGNVNLGGVVFVGYVGHYVVKSCGIGGKYLTLLRVVARRVGGFEYCVLVVSYDCGIIVVDADHIHRDEFSLQVLGVALGQKLLKFRAILYEQLGVSSLEERLKPNATHALRLIFCGENVLARGVGGINGGEVDDGTDFALKSHLAIEPDGAVMSQNNVVNRKIAGFWVLFVREPLAACVFSHTEYAGLVEGAEEFYSVAKALEANSRIFGIPIHEISAFHTSAQLYVNRRIPVIDIDEGLYSVFYKQVDYAVVKINTCLVYLARAVRQNSCPGYRKPKGFQTELLHFGNIRLVIFVKPRGRLGLCVVVKYLGRYACHIIPRRFTLSVCIGRALYLKRRGCGAEEKVPRKLKACHIIILLLMLFL